MNILRIYDNGGESYDRYTVVTNYNSDPKEHGVWDCLGLSDNPTDPQGFSQWGRCKMGKHLGKIIKLYNLPISIQHHIKQRLSDDLAISA